MKAFGYTDRNAKVIFSLLIVSAYLGFALGRIYHHGIMEILIGVIKDTVPEKIEHNFD